MSFPQKFEIALTTASNGSCTAYSEVIRGVIYELDYIKTDFADGVDFVVTLESTGEVIWAQNDVNAATLKVPMRLAHDSSGNATTQYVPFAVANDRIKVVIASGGSVRTGRLDVKTV